MLCHPFRANNLFSLFIYVGLHPTLGYVALSGLFLFTVLYKSCLQTPIADSIFIHTLATPPPQKISRCQLRQHIHGNKKIVAIITVANLKKRTRQKLPGLQEVNCKRRYFTFSISLAASINEPMPWASLVITGS